MTFDPQTATVEDLRKDWTTEFQLTAEQITWLLDRVEQLGNVAAPERLVELITALEFYADPTTYFAIGFFPDHPAGEFMDDFSETELGHKPGKLARATLYLDAEPATVPKRIAVKAAIEQLQLAPEVKDCLLAIWTEITQAAEQKIARMQAWNKTWKRKAAQLRTKFKILQPAFAQQVKLTKEYAAKLDDAEKRLGELRQRLDTRKCPVYDELCQVHNYIHGAEAEELRRGVERAMEECEEGNIDELTDSLCRLLDTVDARDSVGWLEAREREKRIEEMPTFDRGEDPTNETCQGCGKHISRHYGMEDYRCHPLEDEDARS